MENNLINEYEQNIQLKRLLISNRNPNIYLLNLNNDSEFFELDLGDNFDEEDKKYTCNFLNEIRTTFFLTTYSYETLKKQIFKEIYQLSKTINNIDNDMDQSNYSFCILNMIQKYKKFNEECKKNINLFAIPFIYGIELLFRRFSYSYKLPSGTLTDEDLIKFESIVKKINIFLKYSGPSHNKIGSGLIFKICTSIIENINVYYAEGGSPNFESSVRLNIVHRVFNIPKIKRKKRPINVKNRKNGFYEKIFNKLMNQLK